MAGAGQWSGGSLPALRRGGRQWEAGYRALVARGGN